MKQGISQRLWPRIGSLVLASFFLTGCMDTDVSDDSAAQPVSKTLPQDTQLRDRLDETILAVLKRRRLTLKDNGAWQIIHGALAFQRAFPVERDGQMVSAIEHVLAGGKMKGWTFEPGVVLDEKTGRRGLRAIVEAGTKTGQGHADQWLGYLSECGLQPDEKIRVGEDTFTIADIIAQAELDVPRNVEREYSWTLMGLTSYRPTDYQWVASDGQTWNIEKLVGVEVEYDLASSACGGTHRMYGLSMALNRHIAQGRPVEGAWKEAQEKIEATMKLARDYQNPDGSFSTNYFERPGNSADLAQCLGSTGHILEFLAMATTDEQVREPWMQRAALRLCDILKQTSEVELECGALYHATHGLILYRQRLFGPLSFPKPPGSLASAQ